jgi:hypothetical protein
VCAGGDGAAQECAGVVAAVDGQGGAGVDYDGGFAELLVGSGDVEDAVDAGLGGIFGFYVYRDVDVAADPFDGLLGGGQDGFFDFRG